MKEVMKEFKTDITNKVTYNQRMHAQTTKAEEDDKKEIDWGSD